MKSLWRLLLSRRAAVAAMAVTAALLALASFAPDPGEPGFEALRRRSPGRAWLVERLEPQRFTRSPAFVLLPGYIAFSVAASMWQRAAARRRAGRRTPGVGRFSVPITVTLRDTPPAAEVRLRDVLARVGLPEARREGGPLHGSQSAPGFAGSMLFHAGLLVTLAGVSFSALGRFSGELVLAEGVPVELDADTMVEAVPPDGLGPLRGLSLEVSQVALEFAAQLGEPLPDTRTGLMEVAAILEAKRGGAPRQRFLASVNAPVSVEGYQLSIHRYGFAPELRVIDPAGRVRADGVAVVRVVPPGAEDTVALDGGGELRVRFYPDFAPRGSTPASRSPRPLRPVIAWRWVQDGRDVAEGLVERGGEADVGGHRVAFPSLRYWLDLLVSRDPGLPWFATGAFLGIAGLAVRFMWHEQSWRATLHPDGDRTRIDLVLSAGYFPALLQERAERVARELARDEEKA